MSNNNQGVLLMKDPAFLFYSSDFLTGVSDLTMEERGQYITLLCLQHQKGQLTDRVININVPGVSDIVLEKFSRNDDGSYVNKRLTEEVDKRKKHSTHQKYKSYIGNIVIRLKKEGYDVSKFKQFASENTPDYSNFSDEDFQNHFNSIEKLFLQGTQKRSQQGTPGETPRGYLGGSPLENENENENENIINNKGVEKKIVIRRTGPHPVADYVAKAFGVSEGGNARAYMDIHRWLNENDDQADYIKQQTEYYFKHKRITNSNVFCQIRTWMTEKWNEADYKLLYEKAKQYRNGDDRPIITEEIDYTKH